MLCICQQWGTVISSKDMLLLLLLPACLPACLPTCLPAGYAALMALVGEPSPATLAQAATLQPALCHALGGWGLTGAAGTTQQLPWLATAVRTLQDTSSLILDLYGVESACSAAAAAAAAAAPHGVEYQVRCPSMAS
jgi:hypothetical protein